jgi:hypothetical protein
MKIYLKLFLAAAIPYTLAFSMIMRNTPLAISIGIILGVVIAAVFGTLQVRSMEGKKKADHSYAVHQTREIEIDLPFDEAVVLAKAAVQSINGTSILKETSPHEGVATIAARTGLNWETYGEKINLHLERIDADTTLLRIESRPRLRTTLIDYGRNLHNVNTISLYLREHTASDSLSRETTPDETVSVLEELHERLMEHDTSRG